jgi:hypothetical protein
MELTQTMHVVCAWLWEAAHANIFAILVREPSEPWQLLVNSRLFVDGAHWGSKDPRAKFVLTLEASTREEAVAVSQAAVARLAAGVLGPNVTRSLIEVDGDVSKALEAFNTHPSIQMRSANEA